MFSLRAFIIKGLRDAVGKLADYQIILNATGWHDKGVLTEEDLIEMQTLIDEKNAVLETGITREELEAENADMKEALDVLGVTNEVEPEIDVEIPETDVEEPEATEPTPEENKEEVSAE